MQCVLGITTKQGREDEKNTSMMKERVEIRILSVATSWVF